MWLGARGSVLAYAGLYDALARRANEAGVPDFHPHKLRHTAAHRWLSKGGSEGGLMSVAGWSDRTCSCATPGPAPRSERPRRPRASTWGNCDRASGEDVEVPSGPASLVARVVVVDGERFLDIKGGHDDHEAARRESRDANVRFWDDRRDYVTAQLGEDFLRGMRKQSELGPSVR